MFLVVIGTGFHLDHRTLCLTFWIAENCSVHSFRTSKSLTLFGCACMVLAAAYEECLCLIEDLSYLSDEAFTKKELIDQEWMIAEDLKYRLPIRLPWDDLVDHLLERGWGGKYLRFVAFFIVVKCSSDGLDYKIDDVAVSARKVFEACVEDSRWSSLDISGKKIALRKKLRKLTRPSRSR